MRDANPLTTITCLYFQLVSYNNILNLSYLAKNFQILLYYNNIWGVRNVARSAYGRRRRAPRPPLPRGKTGSGCDRFSYPFPFAANGTPYARLVTSRLDMWIGGQLLHVIVSKSVMSKPTHSRKIFYTHIIRRRPTSAYIYYNSIIITTILLCCYLPC